MKNRDHPNINEIKKIISIRADIATIKISLEKRISELTQENKRLLEENEILRHSSEIDLLTQSYSRNFYESHIEKICREYLSKNESMGFISIDLDNLKEANDTYGHAHGDTMLKSFSHLLKQCIASDDYSFRMGGDEFLVLLCGSDSDGCTLVESRINEKVQLYNQHSQQESKISFSAGHSVLSHQNEIHEKEYLGIIKKCCHEADRNMYLQKKQKKQT